MQIDLMGNPHIVIKDNPTLANACNRLLKMVRDNPELLDGDSMGEIDRRLFAEICWEEQFSKLIVPERKQKFVDALMKCPESDVFTRARRELLSRNLIKISAKAIISAERQRARISESFNKRG